MREWSSACLQPCLSPPWERCPRREAAARAGIGVRAPPSPARRSAGPGSRATSLSAPRAGALGAQPPRGAAPAPRAPREGRAAALPRRAACGRPEPAGPTAGTHRLLPDGVTALPAGLGAPGAVRWKAGRRAGSAACGSLACCPRAGRPLCHRRRLRTAPALSRAPADPGSRRPRRPHSLRQRHGATAAPPPHEARPLLGFGLVRVSARASP
ncbi:uncharacterized protein LOC141729848 [Zonotrichia albicollis]|uniref:uncharacterized protein LOC141729848 n=1 Tax=Zonotrichia albicollis TaxID=44394 RepID=UPI003D80E62D